MLKRLIAGTAGLALTLGGVALGLRGIFGGLLLLFGLLSRCLSGSSHVDQREAGDHQLAEPVVGYGGVVCDVSPRERFDAIRDATPRGLARLVSLPEVSGYWPHLALDLCDRSGADRIGAPIVVPFSSRPELARPNGQLRRTAPIATQLLLGRVEAILARLRASCWRPRPGG
jgi:hypothetical protein